MFIRILILIFLWVNTIVGQRNLNQRWEEQLQRYVNTSGVVNYSDWKKEEHALLSYLKALENHPPQTYWTPNDHKSYWINVYNAATVSLILKYYPLKSIRQIDSPWETMIFQCKGDSLNLNAIEDLLIDMGDPSILFTLHRGAVSSPKLSREPYYSVTLEKQIKSAAINFLSDPNQNQCQRDKSYLSRIFLWYFRDFGTLKQRVTFLQKHACDEVNQKTKFRYLPFNWQLNE